MVQDKPEIPETLADLAKAIEKLIAGVHDPAVVYGVNEDPYGKCVEVMWRAAYLAHEIVARELGVTGFQHGMSSLMLLGALRDMKGPYRIVDASLALYPQYDLVGETREFLERPSTRQWLADEAQKRLDEHAAKPTHEWEDEDGKHSYPTAHPDVVAHWRDLVAGRPAKTEAG